mgnify:CR=1 FL=1
MGMAASQARLLTITARLHDIEYQAQSIQNAKVQLATQQDQIYQDYLAALDATTLTVKDYTGAVIAATFNNLTGPNAVQVNGNGKYAFYDSRNRLIVSEEIKSAYDTYKNAGYADDPYMFAMYMVNPELACQLDGGSGLLDESYTEQFAATTDKYIQDNELETQPPLKGFKESVENLLLKAGIEDVDSSLSGYSFFTSCESEDNKKALEDAGLYKDYQELKQKYMTEMK